MDAPRGWVSPQWRALSTRPLILGLPYGAFFGLALISAWLGFVQKAPMPALILLFTGWLIGAAVTRYDAWGIEVLVAAMRMPRVLRTA